MARVEASSLQLHRLVQAILRSQPSSIGTDGEDMAMVAVLLLAAAVPAEPWGNPPTWPAWRALLPHVLAATDSHRPLDPAGEDSAGCSTGPLLTCRPGENPAPPAPCSNGRSPTAAGYSGRTTPTP